MGFLGVGSARTLHQPITHVQYLGRELEVLGFNAKNVLREGECHIGSGQRIWGLGFRFG